MRSREPSGERSGLIDVALSSWIVQDGNHGEFAVGRQARFALEFFAPEPPRPCAAGVLEATPLGGGRCRARVAFAAPAVWVLDAGAFLAYQEHAPPPGAVAGATLEGEVHLGIDPFFYAEYLHRLDGMPPLSYRWVVREILLETTPWVTRTDSAGREYLTRDEARESFVPVAETDAWKDDGGRAAYVLRCECYGGPERPAGGSA